MACGDSCTANVAGRQMKRHVRVQLECFTLTRQGFFATIHTYLSSFTNHCIPHIGFAGTRQHKRFLFLHSSNVMSLQFYHVYMVFILYLQQSAIPHITPDPLFVHVAVLQVFHTFYQLQSLQKHASNLPNRFLICLGF